MATLSSALQAIVNDLHAKMITVPPTLSAEEQTLIANAINSLSSTANWEEALIAVATAHLNDATDALGTAETALSTARTSAVSDISEASDFLQTNSDTILETNNQLKSLMKVGDIVQTVRTLLPDGKRLLDADGSIINPTEYPLLLELTSLTPFSLGGNIGKYAKAAGRLAMSPDSKRLITTSQLSTTTYFAEYYEGELIEDSNVGNFYGGIPAISNDGQRKILAGVTNNGFLNIRHTISGETLAVVLSSNDFAHSINYGVNNILSTGSLISYDGNDALVIASSHSTTDNEFRILTSSNNAWTGFNNNVAFNNDTPKHSYNTETTPMNPVNLQSIAGSDDLQVLAVGTNTGCNISLDGGASWETVTQGSVGSYVNVSGDGQKIMLQTSFDGSYLYSNDGGVTFNESINWTNYFLRFFSEPFQSSPLTTVACVMKRDGSSFGILYRYRAGDNWANGLIVSTDEGNTWSNPIFSGLVPNNQYYFGRLTYSAPLFTPDNRIINTSYVSGPNYFATEIQLSFEKLLPSIPFSKIVADSTL